MRKAVTGGGESEQEGRGRRYWVRAHPSEPKTPAEGAPKRPPKARFLEPYRLAEERRGALLDALIAAGVGDPESRDLFATAVEYDIASFRQSCAGSSPPVEPEPVRAPVAAPIAEPGVISSPTPVPPEPAPGASGSTGARPCPLASDPPPALIPVGAAARDLAGRIAALDPADRSALAAALQDADPFRRGYDGGYLDALCGELERIGGTWMAKAPPARVEEPPVQSATVPVTAPAQPPEPALSAAGQRFVRRVARVYEQCLEAKPSIDTEGPFLAVLRILAPEAGVRLPIAPGALGPIVKDR